jgi:hypothetical protein
VLNREDYLTCLKTLVETYEREGAASKAAVGTMQTLLAVQAYLFKPYIWEGEDYVLKIRHDSSFLKDSSLSKLYEFSKRSDPFLLFPN